MAWGSSGMLANLIDRKVDEVLDQVPLTVTAELVGMLGTCIKFTFT
jgi:hypothetical protein